MKKNSNNAITKQRRRLFISQLLSFAGLFLVLGIVVFFTYEHAVYQNIDETLDHQRIKLVDNSIDDVGRNPLRSGTPNDNQSAFRTQVIVFSAAGKITNKAQLGETAYAYFKHLALNKRQVNRKRTLITHSGTFRTLLIRVSRLNLNTTYAGHYVLIVQNIDPQMDALASFRQALTVTILIFWILAMLLAVWLSNRALDPIVKAWNRQQDFVADAAHELRAPLAVIQSEQETLLTKPTAKIIDQSEAIATTLGETKRLRQLTDDLLTIAKADGNAQQLAPVETDLPTYFDHLLAPYQDIAKSQQKAFDFTLPTAGKGTFDPERIHQLVVIFLDNAFKYTSPGDSIWVSVTATSTEWALTVGNSGPSITDQDKAHIFERFYRVDPSRNRHTGGSGLGLSIAEWIVMAHHGRLSVTDVAPTGVAFTAKFPVKFKA